MNSRSVDCFINLMKDVPGWLEECAELARSIEDWRSGHHDAHSIDPPSRPNASSSKDSSKPIENSQVDCRRASIRRGTTADVRQLERTSLSRKIIVVHYDASIQKQIEAIVRGISIGRGYVRKGKMAARVSSYSTLRADSVSGRSLRQKRSNSSWVEDDKADLSNDHSQALDDIESALSDSQVLCEHAAHQLLRDGDCDEDLESTKRCFKDILRICKNEHEKSILEEPCFDDERECSKKQKHVEVLSTVSAAGAFGIDMTMESLGPMEIDDTEDLDGFSPYKMPDRFAGLAKMTTR